MHSRQRFGADARAPMAEVDHPAIHVLRFVRCGKQFDKALVNYNENALARNSMVDDYGPDPSKVVGTALSTGGSVRNALELIGRFDVGQR